MSNRFEGPPNESDSLEDDSDTSHKKPKAPPIFVAEIGYLKLLTELLEQIAPEAFRLKCLYDNQIKIQPLTSDSYRNTIKALRVKMRNSTLTK